MEATLFAIGTAPEVVGQVRAAIQKWLTFAERAALPQSEAQRIAVQLLPMRRRRTANPVTRT